MADNNNSETSLKQIIQNMTGGEVSVYQGTVLSANPLKIQIANDEKLIITSANTYVPRHLQDYTTTVDISGGSVSGSTASGGGHSHTYNGTVNDSSHTHSISGNTESGGDPEHTHSISGETGSDSHTHSYSGATQSAGAHTHSLSSFSVTGASMTVYNALKAGDTVHILSFCFGKQYYVLDRV